MNKNNILITIKKELRSIVRDKKTLLMIICFPFMISVFIFLYGYMDKNMFDDSDKTLIGVNYEVSMPEESILNEVGLNTIYNKDINKLKEDYNDGKIDAYIDYNEKDNKYIVYGDTTNSTDMTIRDAMMYLDSYNRYLGDQYIKGEDIDPEVVYKNFEMEVKSPDGKEFSEKDLFLSIVMSVTFVYIITSIAISTINMAVSAIAVEKENGTLETILTLPITIKELILGKYIATVIIGIISSLIALVITIVSFLIASNIFEIYSDMSFGVSTLLIGIIICIIASLFIGALAIVITSSAKTYKEAQASSQILQIMCLAPMFLDMFGFKMNSMDYLIPILNHSTILMDLYTGKLNYINLVLTIISTLIYSSILIYYLIKKFKSEKVLFGV